MRFSTGKTLLIVLAAIFLGGMVVLAVGGDSEARRELPAQFAAWGTVALVLFAGWWFRVRPRRELHRAEAQALRLTSAPGDAMGFLDRPFLLAHVPASVRDVESTSWGTWRGRDVAVVEYWFARSSDPSRQDHEYYTCVLVPAPAEWPRLAVLPERLESRVLDAVASRDVQLELEAFNRTFEVRAEDRRFASALLDARMMDWLLSLPAGSGFEIRDRTLLFHVPRRLDSNIGGALETTQSFLDRVPSVVSSLYGSDRQAGSPS